MIAADHGKQATIIFKQNKFLLTGDLDFSNVHLIYEKSLNDLQQAQQLIFDFSEVQFSNSAGLALVVEWIQYAKKNKKNISFIKIPENLLSIAKIAGIEQIFCLQPV